MKSGWRYRLAGLAGTVLLTAIAVAFVNTIAVQSVATTLPGLARFPIDPPTGHEFVFEIAVTVLVFILAFLPLYKPRPRRILDIVSIAQRRVFAAMFALAAIGYFDYTYRLPRLTVLLVTPVLLVVLPLWFIWIRRQPSANGERTVVVGDDLDIIEQVASEVEGTLLGYLCPTVTATTQVNISSAVTDGGVTTAGLERLGGLSRMEDILVEYDVDTVVLAFEHTDRAEFFGALDACYEYGITAKVHRDYADSVLTPNNSVGTLIDVEIEPWDIQDYVLKRLFDVAFAIVGLLVLSPVIVVIIAAIRFEDSGPLLYRQERTAVFGEPFDIYKFRTMVPQGESATPIEDDKNDRITAVGRFLRRTHLDEIPQLWSVLLGEMSVVGPRAVWTKEEALLEAETQSWRQRWFVKPGLTGLAQVNDIKSTNPAEKLRLDLEYIRKQSFWLDMKLVVRQLWKVLGDVVRTVRSAMGK
jgi:lipopolysaccharide/colanic/teichoic acid biosynthesis glycosyltransferase